MNRWLLVRDDSIIIIVLSDFDLNIFYSIIDILITCSSNKKTGVYNYTEIIANKGT